MYNIIKILFLLILFGGQAYGQTQTFKEIKTLEKQINFSQNEKLIIYGERTFITLRTWEQPTIKARVEVISRHSNQEQAKSDLDKIKVIFDKKGRTHSYSNAIQLAKDNAKPKSNLKINLEIFVPKNADVEIENHFGKIDVEGDYKSFKTTSDFSSISISNFSGNSEISSKYGDAVLNNCKGEILFTANRSNLVLKKIEADIKVDIQYGELEYYYSAPTFEHIVRAKYSPVRLHIPDELSNSIDIKCNHCDIVSNNDPLIFNKNQSEALLSGTISPRGKGPKGSIYSELEDVEVFFQSN